MARTFAGRLGTAARIAQIKHELHLDQPLYLQYSHWAWNVLHGNLGYDYYKGEPVISAIAQAAPATISSERTRPWTGFPEWRPQPVM